MIATLKVTFNAQEWWQQELALADYEDSEGSDENNHKECLWSGLLCTSHCTRHGISFSPLKYSIKYVCVTSVLKMRKLRLREATLLSQGPELISCGGKRHLNPVLTCKICMLHELNCVSGDTTVGYGAEIHISTVYNNMYILHFTML